MESLWIPLADKLLVCSALICLIELEKVPSWIVIIIIAREFIISGFRLIAAEHQIVIAASMWGKFKTTFQMVAIVLLILDCAMGILDRPDQCGTCAGRDPFVCGAGADHHFPD